MNNHALLATLALLRMILENNEGIPEVRNLLVLNGIINALDFCPDIFMDDVRSSAGRTVESLLASGTTVLLSPEFVPWCKDAIDCLESRVKHA